MTATNSGIQYAVQIVTKHFGNLVAKVCETLLKSGPSNLSGLIRSTKKLNPQKVKNSLLILVQPFVQESSGDGLRYMEVCDNILHRLRFAKFLAIVADELGDDCKQILAGLLEHGRLTQQQLMDRANQKSKSNKSQVEKNTVEESFVKLVTSHFVERCPVAEPLLEDTPEQEGPKKPKTKSAKMLQVTETLEQRVLAATRPKPALRFSILTDSETDSLSQKSENDSSSMSAGMKFDDLDNDEGNGSKVKEVVLWRANFEQFFVV